MTKAVTTSRDPVCGMAIEVARSSRFITYRGMLYHFCSAHCLERFNDIPALYTGSQRHLILQVCQLGLHHGLLRGKQTALRIQPIQLVGHTVVQPQLRQLAAGCFSLQQSLLGLKLLIQGVAAGQRVGDFAKSIPIVLFLNPLKKQMDSLEN